MKLHLNKQLRAALMACFASVAFSVAQAADVTVNLADGDTQSSKPAVQAGDNVTITVADGATATWAGTAQIDVKANTTVNVGAGADFTVSSNATQHAAFTRNADGSQTINLAAGSTMTTHGTLSGWVTDNGCGTSVINMEAGSVWNIDPTGVKDKCEYMNRETVNMDAATINISNGYKIRVERNADDHNFINTAATATGMSKINGPGTITLQNHRLNFGVERGAFELTGDNTADLQINATIVQGNNGNRGIKKTGTGVLELTAANSYAGGTTVDAGTLRLAGTAGKAGSGAITVAAGATLELAHTEAYTLGNNLTLNGSLLVTGVNETVSNVTINNGQSLVIGDGSILNTTNLTNNGSVTIGSGSTLAISGNVNLGSAIDASAGSLTVGGTASVNLSNLTGTYAWDSENSKLKFSTNIGKNWTIAEGASVGFGTDYTYDSSTGDTVAAVALQAVTASTFSWGGDTPGVDVADNAVASSGALVRFAGGTQEVTLAQNTTTPFMYIAAGTEVTMFRSELGTNNWATLTADTVLLNGTLRIKDNVGYTVSEWQGDGELVLAWGTFRDNAAAIDNFSGNLRIAAGTGLRFTGNNSAGRTFNKVTVEDGAFFCVNNSRTVDGTHHHVGDIYISGDGLGEDDEVGALKFGEGRRMLGDVHIVGGSASISGWNAEHGYIDGDIIGDEANSTLKTLNAHIGGSGQQLDVVNITGVGTANLSSGKVNVTGAVTNADGGFTKEGAGELAVAGALTVKSGGTVTMTDGTMTVGGISGAGTVDVAEGKTLNVTGGVSHTGGLDKKSAGTLTIGGDIALGGDLAVQAGTVIAKGTGTNSLNSTGKLQLWDNGTLRIEDGRDLGSVTISGYGTLNGGTLDIANGSISLTNTALTFNKRSGADTIILGDGTNTGTLNIAGGAKLVYDSHTYVAGTEGGSFSGNQGVGISLADTNQTFKNLTITLGGETDVKAKLDNSTVAVTSGTTTISSEQGAVAAISVNSGATVKAEQAVTVTGDSTVSGTLEVGSTLTNEGDLTVSNTGKLVLAKAEALTVTGALNLNGATLDLTSIAVSATKEQQTITIASVGSLSGSGVTVTGLDVGDIKWSLQNADGSLVLASGGTVGVILPNSGAAYTLTDSLQLVVAALPVPTTLTGTAVAEGSFVAGGVLTLKLNDIDLTDLTGVSSLAITIEDGAWSGIVGDATGEVTLSILNADGTVLTYDPDTMVVSLNGYVGEGAGKYDLKYIPEPTTATLSLLALAGLAARRRRKH